MQAGYFVMFGYPGEELEDIYQTIEFVREQQPDTYLTTVAYPLRGTALHEEKREQILYPSAWGSYLQRELDLRKRFARPLYNFAIKKLASGLPVYYYRQKDFDAYFRVIEKIHLCPILPTPHQYQNPRWARFFATLLMPLDQRISHLLPDAWGGDHVCYILKPRKQSEPLLTRNRYTH